MPCGRHGRAVTTPRLGGKISRIGEPYRHRVRLTPRVCRAGMRAIQKNDGETVMAQVRSTGSPGAALNAPATDFHGLIAAIDRSPIAAPELSTAALAKVLTGVITGEGPTTQGRPHFSRTLDAEDAALCARILTARGMDGAAVTRGEAEMLFEINAAAADRADAGRFDDLFVKAITHHVMAAGGRLVPPRSTALSADVPLDVWAPRQADNVDIEILEWIASHVRGKRRNNRSLMMLAAFLGGTAATIAQSLVSIVDLAS